MALTMNYLKSCLNELLIFFIFTFLKKNFITRISNKIFLQSWQLCTTESIKCKYTVFKLHMTQSFLYMKYFYISSQYMLVIIQFIPEPPWQNNACCSHTVNPLKNME